MIANKLFAMSIISIIMTLTLVSAAGVASMYFIKDAEGNEFPMMINPGETKDMQYTLTNQGSSEAVAFRVTQVAGQDIAAIVNPQEMYIAPANSENTTVTVRVTVPANAPIGQRYKISFEFFNSPALEKGQFQFASSIIRSFEVVVEEKKVTPAPVINQQPAEEKSNGGLWIALLIVVIVVVLAAILIKASRKPASLPAAQRKK